MSDNAPGSSRPRSSHTPSASNKGRKRTVSRPPELSEPASTAAYYDEEPEMGSNDGRPPSKRARKVINCDPCRASKLKCDRARPCSSCVLRGTSDQCYADDAGGQKQEASQDVAPRIDPAVEFEKIRQSLGALESFVAQRGGIGNSVLRRAVGTISESISDETLQTSPNNQRTIPSPVNRRDPRDVQSPDLTVPGELGNTAGGLYTGSTSAATHLITPGDHEEDGHPESAQPVQPGHHDSLALAQLPNVQVIDSLVQYYFDYCNWVYRHINRPAFAHAWSLYKSGQKRERLTLALCCIMMAIATFYLPEEHEVRSRMRPEETQGDRFYDVTLKLIETYREETAKYTLDLVELYLARCHYLTLTKRNPEEIWSLRGDLIKIGTAMGLHRDPARFQLSDEAKERRRWAWWHIILLERWQSFMFGRPLAIASHHFDTAIPSQCEPKVDRTGRLYEPNWALLRLSSILGDIMDKAVSLRPVPFREIVSLDGSLQKWFRNLPRELSFTNVQLKAALSSNDISKRRLGVQHVVVLGAYYHIRFTLHRPYCLSATGMPGQRSEQDCKDGDYSLKIAVEAAEKLITLLCNTRPEFISNMSLAVPGHLNWAPFHLFSAAMFFTFQLLANPKHPSADKFRGHISRALDVLREAHAHANVSVADKAYTILSSLAPLYSPEYSSLPEAERRQRKSDLLARVRGLAFPYKDHTGAVRPNASGLPTESRKKTHSVTSGHTPSSTSSPVVEQQQNPYAPPPPVPSSQFGIAYGGGGGAVGDPGPSTLANRHVQQPQQPLYHPQPTMMPSASSSTLLNSSPLQTSDSVMMDPPLSTSSSLSHAMYLGSPPAQAPQQMQATLDQPWNFTEQFMAVQGAGMGTPGRGFWGASMGFNEGEWTTIGGNMGTQASQVYDMPVAAHQQQWSSWQSASTESLNMDNLHIVSQPGSQGFQMRYPPGL